MNNQGGQWNETEFDEVIEEEEVEQAIERMNIGKALGRDNIAGEFVKYGGMDLVRSLQMLFQKAWEKKRIPKE